MNDDYKRFDKTMTALMRVSHETIKAKLDAEKAEKKQKRKSKTSASGRASRAKD